MLSLPLDRPCWLASNRVRHAGELARTFERPNVALAAVLCRLAVDLLDESRELGERFELEPDRFAGELAELARGLAVWAFEAVGQARASSCAPGADALAELGDLAEAAEVLAELAEGVADAA